MENSHIILTGAGALNKVKSQLLVQESGGGFSPPLKGGGMLRSFGWLSIFCLVWKGCGLDLVPVEKIPSSAGKLPLPG